MAVNKIQVKRTSISGRTPNTTNVANGSFIDAGELAINMADGVLYSSDGTNLITVGANVISSAIGNLILTGGIYANGSYGFPSYVLTSNGSGVYWATAGGGGQPYTKYSANTVLYNFETAMLNTSNGSFYAALPNTTFEGAWIKLVDGGGDKYSQPVTVARGTYTINDSTDDLVIDVPNFKIELVYTGTTWKVIA